MSNIFVIRKQVLQEDEGMDRIIASFKNSKDAEEFLKEYIKDGYFERSDFSLALDQRTDHKKQNIKDS